MAGAAGVPRAAFGRGMGSIWLDNVHCGGTELRLADCPANAIGSHNCQHSDDAGVRCGSGSFGNQIYVLHYYANSLLRVQIFLKYTTGRRVSFPALDFKEGKGLVYTGRNIWGLDLFPPINFLPCYHLEN